jgi:hypothetical protein
MLLLEPAPAPPEPLPMPVAELWANGAADDDSRAAE